MSDGRHLPLLHPQLFDPLIFIKVIDYQISQYFVKIVHASIYQHKSSKDPRGMIPSSEPLQLILLSLFPDSSINVIGKHFFQGERLSDPRQSRLTSIRNELIVIAQ